MKNLIITVALLLVFLFAFLFQQDINQMERQQRIIKDQTEQIANAAALYIDQEAFAMGFIVYNYDEGFDAFDAAVRMFTDNISSAGFDAKGDYYTDKTKFYLYFFDDNQICRKYNNANNAATKTYATTHFTYGDMASSVTDIETFVDEDFRIDGPCVACIVDMGKPRFRLASLAGKGRIAQMSVYEYVD